MPTTMSGAATSEAIQGWPRMDWRESSTAMVGSAGASGVSLREVVDYGFWDLERLFRCL
jgi:hypothetical protein